MEYKGQSLSGRDIATVELLQEIKAYFSEDGAALNALALGGVNANSYALKTDVDKSIADLVGAAPDTLDTLGELATALKENADVVATLDAAITAKADKTALDEAVGRITTLENSATKVSFSQTLTGGIKIGSITIDGTTTNIYAPSLTGYATQSWVNQQGFITGIDEDMVLDALGFTPFDAEDFTKANIKSKLGISDWALASSKPSYAFSDLTSHPTTLSGYGITDALAKTGNAASATKLSDNTEYTVWGRPFFKNGKPVNVTSSPIYSRNGGFYAYNYKDESTMLMWYMSDNTKSEFILGHKSSENLERTRICGYPISFHIGKYVNANGVPLTPAMLIDEEGDVTIEGNLIVKGTIASGGKAIEGQSALVGPLSLNASITTGTKTQTQMNTIGFTTTAIANMEAGIYTKVVYNGLVWEYSVKRSSSTSKIIYLRNDAGTSYTMTLSGTTWTIS